MAVAVSIFDCSALQRALDVVVEEDAWDNMQAFLFATTYQAQQKAKLALQACMKKFDGQDDRGALLQIIVDETPELEADGFCFVEGSAQIEAKTFWAYFRAVIFSQPQKRLEQIVAFQGTYDSKSLQKSAYRWTIFKMLLLAMQNVDGSDLQAQHFYKTFFNEHVQYDEVERWLCMLNSEKSLVGFIEVLYQFVLPKIAGASHPFQEKLITLCRTFLSKKNVSETIAFFQETLPRPLFGDALWAELVYQSLYTDHPIVRRCMQLQKDHLHTLQQNAMLRLAICIETKLKGYIERRSCYIKKEQEGLFFSVILSADSFYLLYKKKVLILDENGTYKRVTAALCVPQDVSQKTYLVAQAVSKAVHRHISFTSVQKEVEMARALQNIDGLLRVLFDCQYKKIVKLQNGTFEVVDVKCVMFPLYEGSIKKIYESIILVEKCQIAAKICKIVSDLHANGYIHGDLKLDNVLYRKKDQGFEIVLCDFGFTFHTEQNQNASTFNRHGLYGTLMYTAPEVLEMPALFTGDYKKADTGNYKKADTGDYKKAEIWALGMLFYLLYIQEEFPPWKEMMQRYCDKTHPIGWLHSQLIPEIKKHLSSFEKSTPDDPFLTLIYAMLNQDPKKRPDAAECAARLSLINK